MSKARRVTSGADKASRRLEARFLRRLDDVIVARGRAARRADIIDDRPLFDADRRYSWRYADDRLRVTDETNATLIVNGDLAGRIADALQALEMAGLHMQPILSILWHAAAAGGAGLIYPEHEVSHD
jgi:hypothetical protein